MKDEAKPTLIGCDWITLVMEQQMVRAPDAVPIELIVEDTATSAKRTAVSRKLAMSWISPMTA